jgi:hypothetical protein
MPISQTIFAQLIVEFHNVVDKKKVSPEVIGK